MEGLPCMGYPRTPNVPPKCSTIPWRPRQTPKPGIPCLIKNSIVVDSPKSDGLPGPGESTTLETEIKYGGTVSEEQKKRICEA